MHKPPLILIVDDETHIVHVLSVKLQSAGFNVISAMDGREGLRRAIDEVPDLVIADNAMPVADGFEMCHGLLRISKTSHIPVIMLTGKSHRISDHDAHISNIRAMVGKPFSPRDVLNKVYELLDIHPDKEAAKAS